MGVPSTIKFPVAISMSSILATVRKVSGVVLKGATPAVDNIPVNSPAFGAVHPKFVKNVSWVVVANPKSANTGFPLAAK